MACTRWQLLSGFGAQVLRPALATQKVFRGVFVIMETPCTEDRVADFDDLARPVEFIDGCGTLGMVWPQLASEYSKLTREERLRGMEVIAPAARGKKPVLVPGVQAATTEAMLEYARRAEALAPATSAPAAVAEIEFNLEVLKPYLRVPLP